MLWCAVPAPSSAVLCAISAVLGRAAIFPAAVQLWNSSLPRPEALVQPGVVFCSVLAWIGLAAEYLFVRRVLAYLPIPAAKLLNSGGASDQSSLRADWAVEEQKPIIKRNVGLWFKLRFPKAYAVAAVLAAPAFGILSLSSGDKSLAQAIPVFFIVLPAVLQCFMLPPRGLGDAITELIQPVNELQNGPKIASNP